MENKLSDNHKEENNIKAVPPAKKAINRKILVFNIISFSIVLAALIWAVITYFHLGKSVYTNDAQVDSYVNPINSRVPGYIKEIRFNEHQHVKRGDTLVIIDRKEYLIQLKLAEASLLDASAGKTVISSAQDVANKGIAISEANILEVKARLTNAEANFKRYANLLKDDVITQFQFDQQQSERDALRAKLESLQSASQSARFSGQESRKRVDVADAAIIKANANLDYAKLNLSYTIITAPYDGTVGRRVIEEGQYIQAAQTLLSIVRDSERWITANYTEAQLAYLTLGQKVKIHIDATGDRVYYGNIVAVSEATGSRFSAIPVDNSTGNFVKVQQRFPVKIDFLPKTPARDLKLLKTGMNAEVELIK
jgi:membrane fusion protein (multidrug efflux system)